MITTKGVFNFVEMMKFDACYFSSDRAGKRDRKYIFLNFKDNFESHFVRTNLIFLVWNRSCAVPNLNTTDLRLMDVDNVEAHYFSSD